MDPTDPKVAQRAVDKPAQNTPVTVALNHDRGQDNAAVVTAAARGALAAELLAIAFAHGIPVREDADLAEVLAAMEVESEIPLAAAAAVAEILSYVYRLNRETDD